MLIAQLDTVGLTYGTRRIFDGLSLILNDGDKLALIGPNGAGKSSLLRILAGLESPTSGARTLRRGARVAYLPQEYGDSLTTTPVAEVLAGRDDLARLAAELAAVEAQLADPACYGDERALARALERQATLLRAWDEVGGDRVQTDAVRTLERLGLPPALHDTPLTALSGGQRKLVGLARCLVARPDLLLLDEPDNHLDMAGKERLTEIINGFAGTLVLISHDRYLLDDTVREIIELDAGRLTRYEGNYSEYAANRELALLRQKQDFVTQQKEIKRLEETIARYRLWAKMVLSEAHRRQADNKQRMLDRMDKVERPVLERRKMGLALASGARGGQKVIEARHLAKLYDAHVVLLGVDFTVMRGERIGVVGANGAGKSVLFRLLLGQEAPTEGDVWVGPSIHLGHYAQQHDTLDAAITPLHFIRTLRPMREQEAVGFLGKFLFTYIQVQAPIGALSGGEKSRLQLARLMLGGENCLLLDEPTNHLDIASTEVLEDALSRYDGTVIAISHDRYFLDRICTQIYELADGELTVYAGGYSEYVVEKARRAAPPPPTPPPATGSAKAQRREGAKKAK